MVRCPLCRDLVEELHSVPPAVVTRSLVDAAGGAEQATKLEGCASCISALMDGRDVT